jgi:hypothetical protein
MNEDFERRVEAMAKQERDRQEMDRNARAYGWEIGHGKPLAAVIEFSEDNPFLDPTWRDLVTKT